MCTADSSSSCQLWRFHGQIQFDVIPHLSIGIPVIYGRKLVGFLGRKKKKVDAIINLVAEYYFDGTLQGPQNAQLKQTMMKHYQNVSKCMWQRENSHAGSILWFLNGRMITLTSYILCENWWKSPWPKDLVGQVHFFVWWGPVGKGPISKQAIKKSTSQLCNKMQQNRILICPSWVTILWILNSRIPNHPKQTNLASLNFILGKWCV